MKCPRCHNSEETYFYTDLNGITYCRKCIMFGRINVNEVLIPKKHHKRKLNVKYELDFKLTKYQKKAVKQLNSLLKRHKDVLIFAATGAGKSEIIMESIQNYLNEGKCVGIAIARRQVVLEISERMKKAFPSIDVIAVCEGYTKRVEADLIVCTMHQLYRYHQYFDLLIMDEVDAFPYYGNEVLSAIAKHSCKHEMIYLTATPDETMLSLIENNQLEVVKLFKRPHGYPLIVPKSISLPLLFQYIYVLSFLLKQKKKKKSTIVFVPTIKMANQLSLFLNIFIDCKSFTSKSINKDEYASLLRNKEIDALIATTVLERGITISGVDVIVLYANHIVFNKASLVQIAGRVGRSMKYPQGTCIFLMEYKNKEIKECISMIKMMNEDFYE